MQVRDSAVTIATTRVKTLYYALLHAFCHPTSTVPVNLLYSARMPGSSLEPEKKNDFSPKL